jgi:hypothetical protein
VSLAWLPRPSDPELEAWLAREAERDLGVEEHVLGPDGARDLVRVLSDGPCRARLEADVRRWLELFCAITGATKVRASFGLVMDDKCRRFHADFIALRLLCTYTGPGTEWLPQEAVDQEALGRPFACPYEANESIVRDARAIRRARPFDVLVLKGEAYPGAHGRGLVHRSPPLGDTGQRRIVLTLTTLGPPR